MFDKKQTNFDKKANCIFETEKDKITKHSLFANLKKGLNETKLNIFPIVESFYNNTDVIPFEHFKTDYSISENEQRKRAMGKYIFQNSINFDNWIVPIQIKDVFNNIEKLYNDFFEVANQTKYSLNFSDFEYEFESSKMTNFDKILEKREKLQNRTLYIAIPKNPKTKAQNAQSYKNDILLTNKYHLLILDNLKTVREIKTFFEKNNSLVNIFDCQNISESNPNLIVSDLQTPINKDLLTYCHLTVFENTVDTNFILSFLKTCIDKKIESVWKSIYLRFSFAPKESVLNEILELCEKLEIRVFGILPKNFTSKTLCFFSSYELVNDNDNFTKIELSLSDTNNLSRYKYACKQSYYFTEKYHRITFAENYIPTIDIIRNNTDLIRYIFDNHKYIQIKAMTGLGKTYSVKYALSKILYRLGYTVVFAAPRNAIALQQSENKKYVCFVGANNEKAINQMESSKGNPFGNIVFSNYDNIQLAIETVRMHNKKPFLVIDESDQILRDLDFRESQMKKVIESIKEVEKTIFISATPIEMDFLTKETFFLELVSTQKPKYEKPILYLMKTKSYVDFLTSQIPLDIALNKRVLVFYDDIKNLRVIQQSLKNDKIESNIFASKELTKTEQNVFNEVLSESNYQWNSSVNVILTTQVISAGINIETDKETVIYDLNTNTGFDNDKTVQDFSRIRNYDKHSMKYIILTNNQKGFRDNEFLNYGYHFHSELEFAKDNVEMLNNNLNKNASKHGLGFAIEKANRFTDVLLVDFDKELKKFVLSESKLYALKYKTIVENGSPYFFDLKEIQTFDEIETNENNKAIKLFLKNNQTEIEKDVCNLFLNNFETLLSVTKKHTKDNRLKLIITQIVGANEYSEIDFISTENDYFGSYLLVMEKLLENYFSMFETEISKLNYINNEYKKLFIEKVVPKNVESESEKTESFHKIKSKNDMKKDKEKYRNLSIFIKKEKYEKAEKEKQKDFVLSSSEMQTYNSLKNIIDIVSESENHIDSELLKKVNYQKRNSDRLKSYKMFEYLNYFFDIKQSKKNIQIVSKKDVQIEFESLTDIEL